MGSDIKLESRFLALLGIDNLTRSLNKVNNYKNFCQEQVEKIDKELIDLDHCLELNSLNCVQQSKLIKQRKEELHKRRFYKDELEYMHQFEKSNINVQSVVDNLRTLKSDVKATQNRLENRQYTPRILYEIFGISAEEKAELEQRKKDRKLLGNKATNRSLDMESKFRKVSSI